jgi:hypothetical protein
MVLLEVSHSLSAVFPSHVERVNQPRACDVKEGYHMATTTIDRKYCGEEKVAPHTGCGDSRSMGFISVASVL